MLSNFFFFVLAHVFIFSLRNSKYVCCFYIPKVCCTKLFYLKESNDASSYSEGRERYMQEKKMKQLKLKAENKVVKQLRITPRIGTNDLLIKINSAKQFLLRRHRVKFILTLKGREYTNVENVKKIFAKISEELKSYGNSETMRQNGNVVSQLFNLKAKRKNESSLGGEGGGGGGIK
ncbi:translation initiation factor IF-3 [Plasmodium cynomolgi strain B]|uniref:Translation initiation factor IF-3 n=1 Tax=Plasmodium cynomolgi (strain B) TaxID=1120755 RepID=K6V7P7_PLACD|nr:translation initiation factor IF-3 [Plasmodium cynomolgi strain B]GAB65142.1 translation initiation factor IF-3 [Plasmodium cynomolgi strain B]